MWHTLHSPWHTLDIKKSSSFPPYCYLTSHISTVGTHKSLTPSNYSPDVPYFLRCSFLEKTKTQSQICVQNEKSKLESPPAQCRFSPADIVSLLPVSCESGFSSIQHILRQNGWATLIWSLHLLDTLIALYNEDYQDYFFKKALNLKAKQENIYKTASIF